jgi:WD40 repeat protein
VSSDDGKGLRQFSHGACVNRIAFSPDGKLLATSGEDKTVRVWETATGKERHALVHALQDPPNRNYPTALGFSPDGKMIATGATDAMVRLWDTASGNELRTLHGHFDIVTGLLFSTDGQILYSVSWDGSARRWDPNSGRERPVVNDEIAHRHVALSVTNSLLASGGDEGLRLYQGPSGRHLRTLERRRGRMQYVGVFTGRKSACKRR